MTVVVNGETVEVEGRVRIVDVLRRVDVRVDSAGVAVARNGEVVPRSAWTTVELDAGDHIDVLHAVQGG